MKKDLTASLILWKSRKAVSLVLIRLIFLSLVSSLPVFSLALNQEVLSAHINQDTYLDLCIQVGHEEPMSANHLKSTGSVEAQP